MSRTTSYDAEAAELVSRTLAAVAAAAGSGAADRDLEDDEGDGAVVPLVASLITPGRPGGRRRTVRAAIGLSAAAAAAITGVLVWRDGPDVTTGPARTDEVSPVPAWLPPGVDEDGEPLPTTGETGLAVDAAVLGAPGGGEVLVAAVSHEDGSPTRPYEAHWILGRLAGMFGVSDDEAVVRSADADQPAIVAVPRGEVSDADVDLAVTHGSTSVFGSSGPPADGWTRRMVPVGWAPGLAPTVGQSFSSDDGSTSVEIILVAGELPREGDLGALLGPIEPREIGDVAGWRRPLQDSGQEMLVWQEAPGTIGIVVAGGVPPEDVVRVAASVDADTPPSADGDGGGVRVVGGSNEGSDVAYRIEWADTLPDEALRPCVTLIVEDESSSSRCGIDHPDQTFLSFGPAAVVDGVDVYWGIVGPSVTTVELELSGGRQPVVAEALPLDRGDPDSMRYVVMTAPHTDVGSATARFLGPERQVLDTETIDFVGSLDG
jgi:hypothetical protein